MSTQTTDTILMVRPCAFGYNPETAVNNYFQVPMPSSGNIQEMALAEFDKMVSVLRANDINVLVVDDNLSPHTPDSIFPNNWFSTHADGRIVLYPMYARNRRLERRQDIVQLAQKHNAIKNEIVDISAYEADGRFLEGTGSIIFDRDNGVAYASISERTDVVLFEELCKRLNYKAIIFTARQNAIDNRLPVYHTNVVMCLGKQFVVICMDSVDVESECALLLQSFAETKKQLITITEAQMEAFAGNMLQLTNKNGNDILLMSQAAYKSLTPEQIAQLSAHSKLIPVAVPTIEKHGGGSVRCMVAEIF